MPNVKSTGWSVSQPDPQYIQQAGSLYNTIGDQLTVWGDQVNWQLPTATPAAGVHAAGDTANTARSMVGDAWAQAGQLYNTATNQLTNLTAMPQPYAQTGYNLMQVLDPQLQNVFTQNSLLGTEGALNTLGGIDYNRLQSAYQQAAGGIQAAAVPSISGLGAGLAGAAATGATVSAMDPRRQLIRDIAADRSIDQLGEYLQRVDQDAFRQLQSVAEADLERQRQIQMQQAASRAAAQSAFGGSRHGVVEAETNRAALDAQARLSADMAARKLDFANAILQSDIGRNMTAQQLNQAADLAAELERARLGTQANVATGENVTRANIATAQNQTQANIAGAEIGARGAIEQARLQAEAAMQANQLRAQLGMANLGALANLAGTEYGTRADVLSRMEALKPQMANVQGSLLADIGKAQLQSDTSLAGLNAQLGLDYLNYQRQLGNDLANIATQGVGAAAQGANALTNVGGLQLQQGSYLTDLDLQNQWNKWYGDYMANMWQPQRTMMMYDLLLQQPYGTSTEGGSQTQNSVNLLDILGLGAQIGGAAIAASDPKLKSDVKTRRNSLDEIKKLRPVEYHFKADPQKVRVAGLLASEVGERAKAKIGAWNAVNLEPIVADLVGAVQEIARKVK
jgi:hypothetical protein